MNKRSICIILIALMMFIGGCGRKSVPASVSGNDVSTAVEETQTLPDGEYSVEVTLEGGSGKASISSPAKIIMENGEMNAEIIWSSSNYDYLILDGTKYLSEIKDGRSCFYIPVSEDKAELDIKADTTAMSKPHEIDYKLIFSWESLCDSSGESVDAGVAVSSAKNDSRQLSEHVSISTELGNARKMDLYYAEEFDVWYYDGGYRELRIVDGTRILVIPEGKDIPSDLDSDVKVLMDPVDDIYLVSTASMDYFDKTDSLDRLKFASLEAGKWESAGVNEKMASGDIIYAGKYSSPDYELLKAGECKLVIENTMILHSPQVSEKLEELGFTVMIDMSSYEPDPLGRAEWIRFYGAMLGCEEKADEAYDKQRIAAEKVRSEVAAENPDVKKTALIFYFTENGMVNVKTSSDYLATMIEQCGAEYLYKSPEGQTAGSTSATISSEDFYSMALNADILIYNTTIAGNVASKEELTADYGLITGFAAYKNDEIYRMNSNVFQNPMSAGEIMEEMYLLITSGEEAGDDHVFFNRL